MLVESARADSAPGEWSRKRRPQGLTHVPRQQLSFTLQRPTLLNIVLERGFRVF